MASPLRGLLSHPEITSGRALRKLRRSGYAVIDSALGLDWARRLRSDIEGVRAAGRLHLNATHYVDAAGGVTMLHKDKIWELSSEEISSPYPPQSASAASAATGAATLPSRSLGAHQRRMMPWGTPASPAQWLDQLSLECEYGGEGGVLNHLFADFAAERTTLKIQYNEGGGGCFPYHFDTAPDVDGRVVTGIYYLNEGWVPSHGGELRLEPFPYEGVNVAPAADRLVLFDSLGMLHRVLPAAQPRACLTFWVYGSYEQQRPGGPLDKSGALAPRRQQKRAAPMQPFRLGTAIEAERRPRSGGGGGGGGGGTTPNSCSANRSALDAAPRSKADGMAVEEAAALTMLLRPPLRRHFARLAMDSAWARSLAEAHGADDPASAPATDEALARHAREVAQIDVALAAFLRARGLRGAAADPRALAEKHLPVREADQKGLVSWFADG